MSPKPIFIDFLKVFEKLMEDLGIRESDSTYLLRRARCEGFTFLCKILPSFSKHVIQCIEFGYYTPFRGFPRCARATLPKVFRHVISRIFHDDGLLRSNPSSRALYIIRQTCEYFYKLEVDFTPEQIDSASEKYLQTEREVEKYSSFLKSSEAICEYRYLHDFFKEVRKNIRSLDMVVTYQEILRKTLPRYTTGSFVEYKRIKRKTTPKGFSSPSYIKSTYDAVLPRSNAVADFGLFKILKALPKRCYNKLHQSNATPVSEVLFVPKDSRGPRVISRENLDIICTQMRYHDWMCAHLEKVTHRHVNFENQEINRNLAKEGSLTGNWATIDLSEASDRVSFTLVKKLLGSLPFFNYFFHRHRSSTYKLPNNYCGKMYKVAGMGSGLTFPTMSLIVYSTISTLISLRYSIPFKKAMEYVYVYGDDIIVKKEFYRTAIEALERAGLKVNENKSFSKGPFRESCGGDYISGKDVSPRRLSLKGAGIRKVKEGRVCIKNSNQNTFVENTIISLVEHCKILPYKLWRVREYLYSIVEHSLSYKLPIVHPDSPYIGRKDMYSRLGSFETMPHRVYTVEPAYSRPNKYGWKVNNCTSKIQLLQQSLRNVDAPRHLNDLVAQVGKNKIKSIDLTGVDVRYIPCDWLPYHSLGLYS